MKHLLFFIFFHLLFFSIQAQDLGTIGTTLNQLLIEKEINQTQITYPSDPYIIKMEVPDSYTKEFNIQNVNILVRKGSKNTLTGNLYEVYLSCKSSHTPCILVDIGEEKYMDIHAHLLFEKEDDAKIAGNLLLQLQKNIQDWQ